MPNVETTDLIGDPLLLPEREAPYLLHSVHEFLADGCHEEIVFDWGDSHLIVRVDGEFDTLVPDFHEQQFVPTGAYRDIGACSPWSWLLGKECDWTWVAVNKQGYRDLIILSFDIMLPQVILHAAASSIEVLTISKEYETKNDINGTQSS
jgi:hypothetical protein